MEDRHSIATDSFGDQTAIQYLIWALEEIEKSGNEKAGRHTRSALEALRETSPIKARA
jgi:hypothetical protein